MWSSSSSFALRTPDLVANKDDQALHAIASIHIYLANEKAVLYDDLVEKMRQEQLLGLNLFGPGTRVSQAQIEAARVLRDFFYSTSWRFMT